jgi:predicted nucleic acid-binding protein
MEPAFWDSSSLVPLCVNQQATPDAAALNRQYSKVVWWVAPVEMHGAFARLLRMGQLTSNQNVGAMVRFEKLRANWREISPASELRDRAERLLDRFPLRSADALQLAAALAWASGKPGTRKFISGDAQLLEAATQLGFQVIQA